MPERELTPKELNVVDTFEQTRPGTGSDRKSNILNSQLRLAGNHCRHA
jgi:hypothetical protein